MAPREPTHPQPSPNLDHLLISSNCSQGTCPLGTTKGRTREGSVCCSLPVCHDDELVSKSSGLPALANVLKH
ncbi:hypothetical protein C2E23DRAFT_844307 [Lenzites betulinus]|nr:hypothetical protein C2E23DRAFT_844307 [Lenzites betulinus]